MNWLPVLAILLLVGRIHCFGDVLENRVTCQAAAPTRQPGSLAQGMISTMTPRPGSTPTPRPAATRPAQVTTKPGAAGGIGKLAGAVGLGLGILLAGAVAVLLVLKGLGVAEIHLERQEQEIEETEGRLKDAEQLRKDRKTEGLRRWNLYNKQHREELEIDLAELGEDTGAALGANARLLVDLALDHLDGNANVRVLRRAAYASRGVPYHYTETALRKLRWRADNNWPILVLRGREPSEWILTLRDQPPIPGYARRRTWAFETLPADSEELIVRYEKRKPKRYYL